MRILIVLTLLLISLPALADITGPARVVDGDTIWIGKTKIGIYGIDAPEQRQDCIRNSAPWPCGFESTEHLRSFIGSSPVTCESYGRDLHGRMIGKCQVNDLDIGAEMVSQGLALAFVRFSTDYVQNERDARDLGNGMHAGTFVEPWVWRKKRR